MNNIQIVVSLVFGSLAIIVWGTGYLISHLPEQEIDDGR